MHYVQTGRFFVFIVKLLAVTLNMVELPGRNFTVAFHKNVRFKIFLSVVVFVCDTSSWEAKPWAQQQSADSTLSGLSLSCSQQANCR